MARRTATPPAENPLKEAAAKLPAVAPLSAPPSSAAIPPPEVPGRKRAPLVPPAPVEPDHEDLADDDADDEGEEFDDAAEKARRVFEEGAGVGMGDPALLRPGGERPVDLGPVRSEVSPGRRNEGPLSTDTDELEPLARTISRFGSTIRIRCRRLYPEDMPPTEMGESGWMDVPGGDTGRADIVRSMIERRFGGGRYEIKIADHDPSEYSKGVTTTIDIPGDPIPLSSEGRRWFLQRYGVAPALPSTLDGKPMAPAGAPGGLGGDGTMLGIVTSLLQHQQASADRAMGAVEREKDREVSLVPHLLQFAQAKGTGLQAILPMLPILLEFVKMLREDSRRDREASDARFQALMEKLSEASKPQTPDQIMAGVNSMLQITTKRAELELQSAQKRNDLILEQMVKQLRESGREEDASFMSTLLGMVRESGPELIKGAMPMIAGMMSGARPPVPQNAPPQRAMVPRPPAPV